MKTLNILQAALFSLTPMRIAYNTNVYTYNKTVSTTYLDSTNSNQVIAGYEFVDSDSYNVMNNTIEQKTTILHGMELYNTNNRISVNIFMYTQIKDNGNKFILEGQLINQITNTRDPNLIAYTIGHMTLSETSWPTQINSLDNNIDDRYTNATDIEQQLGDCVSILNNINWDDEKYTIEKSQNPNNFYELVEEYSNNYTNIQNVYLDSDDNNTDKYAVATYINMIFTFTGNYQDLTETTKQSLYNSLIGVATQINYTAKTEMAPVIVEEGGIIDIPGILFTILGMPFAWISTAFNLTLFPNTPYSINIATLLLGVIGLLIAIFIIRKLIK